MNILILTQKIDRNDPILGFFHRWVEEFSKYFGKVTVICLGKGELDLPPKVKVFSLGKEEGRSVLKYIYRFYRYVWSERYNYDIVFVHMNQEYALLGGVLWWLLGKKVYMWRNHAKGNLFTYIAVLLSNKVFYTSPKSYTARFSRSLKMPVGIDTKFFSPDPSVHKVPGSILFLGRIGPVKRVLEFIDWLRDKDFSLVTIAGEAFPKDVNYDYEVRKRVFDYGFTDKVSFIGSVDQKGALRLYRTHEMYVNFTLAGSMDKTILEAAACGTQVIVENEDIKSVEGKRGDELREFVIKNHSLDKLLKMIMKEVQ